MSDEELTEEELNQIVADLDFAQREYEKLVHLSSPIMPCPECGGAGSVSGGSLGDICPGCLGSRRVSAPGNPGIDLNIDFAGIRARLADAQRYNDAVAGRLGPDVAAEIVAKGAVSLAGLRGDVKGMLNGIRQKAGELVLAQPQQPQLSHAIEAPGELDDDDPRLED